MKVLVEIDEIDFENLERKDKIDRKFLTYYEKLIANGTPLPKGNGDLIDRNSILCDDCSCEQCGHTDECFKLLAPTIIEADKAESEE